MMLPLLCKVDVNEALNYDDKDMSLVVYFNMLKNVKEDWCAISCVLVAAHEDNKKSGAT